MDNNEKLLKEKLIEEDINKVAGGEIWVREYVRGVPIPEERRTYDVRMLYPDGTHEGYSFKNLDEALEKQKELKKKFMEKLYNCC